MANKVTITALTGPGEQVTAHVFEPLRSIKFDMEAQIVEVVYGADYLIRQFELYDVTTVTYSISSHVATIAVSQ